MEREDENLRSERQTGPWVLALGVLTVGAVALVRELRRNREETIADDL